MPAERSVRLPDGEIDYIIHLVEEVPELIRKFVDAESAGADWPRGERRKPRPLFIPKMHE